MTIVRTQIGMCEAIPVAARHGWSEKRTCASHACETIVCDLRERHVCRIHWDAYRKAVGEQRQYLLAEDWGWLA